MSVGAIGFIKIFVSDLRPILTPNDKLNEALQQYDEYKEQAKEFNAGEFGKARLDIRSDKEYAIHEQLSKAYGKHFDPLTLVSSRSEIDGKLDDEINMPVVREYVYQQRRQARQQQRNRKHYEQER